MVPFAAPVNATCLLGPLAAARVGDLKATASGLWGTAALDGVWYRPDCCTCHRHKLLWETRSRRGTLAGNTIERRRAIVATPLGIDKHGT